MKTAIVALVLFSLVAVNAVTKVQKCPSARSPEEYKQEVSVGNCKKSPCKLKKGRPVQMEIKFTPLTNTKTLTTTVNAIIVGLPFPFIGVDNTDACPLIYAVNGTEPVGCPLEKGKEYVYKNSFDVLEIYPQISLKVHWGLLADNGEDASCFEVPARIIK